MGGNKTQLTLKHSESISGLLCRVHHQSTVAWHNTRDVAAAASISTSVCLSLSASNAHRTHCASSASDACGSRTHPPHHSSPHDFDIRESSIVARGHKIRN